MKKLKDRIYALLLILGLIGIDQVTKLAATELIKPGKEIPIIGNLLVFRYAKNTGAAFSMFENNKFLLIGLTSVFILICFILVFGGFIKKKFLLYTVSVVLAGGIGNLIDRISQGFVTDFIYIKVINFPIFNFADICVSLAGVAIVIYLLFFDKEITT